MISSMKKHEYINRHLHICTYIYIYTQIPWLTCCLLDVCPTLVVLTYFWAPAATRAGFQCTLGLQYIVTSGIKHANCLDNYPGRM